MKWQVSRNEVNGEAATVCKFPFPIKECAEAEDVLLVLLDVPSNSSMPRNVFAISGICDVLWTIEDAPDAASDPADCYVGIVAVNRNLVRIATWTGWVVEVDLGSGRIVGSQWLK